MSSSETLIGQCVLRAGGVHVRRQLDAGRDPDRPATRREKMSGIWMATRVGANVAAFIVLWASALLELEVDELSVSEFIEWSGEGDRTIYRRLSDFRELFPDEHTPNRIGAVLVAEAHRRGGELRVDLPLKLAAA